MKEDKIPCDPYVSLKFKQLDKYKPDIPQKNSIYQFPNIALKKFSIRNESMDIYFYYQIF